MSTIRAFDSIENKDGLFRGKDCLKKFSTSFREHAKNIIDFEKKKKLPLTKEEIKPYQDAKVCYICRKTKDKKIKIIEKSEIIVIIQGNAGAHHIVFVIQNLTCLMQFV